MMPLPVAVATGDPAGVGPLVAVRAAVTCGGSDRVALFGDAQQLQALLEAEVPHAAWRRLAAPDVDLAGLALGEIGLIDTGRLDRATVEARAPSPEGGAAQLRTLEAALGSVQSGHARALVTGPISKQAVQRSGAAFVGHTEHLARRAGLQDDAVSMLFLGPRLNVALVTTHLAIAEVPSALTSARVARTLRHLAQALARLGRATGDGQPSLAVAGLNPHASEDGAFGDEEARVITPAVHASRAYCRAQGFRIEGPLPAEAAFRQAAAGQHAGVVAMFHDQATIASKLLDWGQAVNVTWGLPFVRTSVDHGVAYQALRDGCVEADGMIAALRMAQRLTSCGAAQDDAG